jgi:hypothetical protein
MGRKGTRNKVLGWVRKGSFEHGKEISVSQRKEIPYHLGDCQLLKEDSACWTYISSTNNINNNNIKLYSKTHICTSWSKFPTFLLSGGKLFLYHFEFKWLIVSLGVLQHVLYIQIPTVHKLISGVLNAKFCRQVILIFLCWI